MLEPIELVIDVTEAAGLGMPAHTAATVFLPEVLADPPVVCFAFPGGGYCRRYFSFDMPGSSGGGEAGWHAEQGWIFVACDHLGFGDSTIPEGNALDYDNVALGNRATVEAVMGKLESGTLHEDFGPLSGATLLGIGQSMGGCFTIVLQGQHRVFDGIASLGYSGIHTVVPDRPGSPKTPWPWIPRGSDLANPPILNQASLGEAPEQTENPFTWAFHYDDVPAYIVAADMDAGAETDPERLPSWRSASVPPCGILMVAPGTVAIEAASITVPVLVAVGERDVVPDPWMEPKAYKSANDITVYVCPRMAHMHNFAGTREQFWRRIHSWGTGVALARRLPDPVNQELSLR